MQELALLTKLNAKLLSLHGAAASTEQRDLVHAVGELLDIVTMLAKRVRQPHERWDDEVAAGLHDAPIGNDREREPREPGTLRLPARR